jgi:hypothetical protein
VDKNDDTRSFRDTDYSVTGVNAGDKTITVITPEPLLLTDKCSERHNWNFAYCEHKYTKVCIATKIYVSFSHLVIQWNMP